MKKLIFFSLLLLPCSAFAEGKVYIQVAGAKVRSEPKLWSTSVADVKFGSEVTLLSEGENGWAKIQVGSKEGYVPITAISSKKVALNANAPKGRASQDDVVLAGKGFDKNTEDQFANAGVPLNYPEVNRLEKVTVSDSQLRTFVKNGKLGGN